MKKLVEFLESPGGETTLRFVFRAAVLLSMLVILFIAASGNGYAQLSPGSSTTQQVVAGNYFTAGMPSYVPLSDRSNLEARSDEVIVKLYPNPVSDYLLVMLPAFQASTVLRVVSQDGRVVAREIVPSGETSAVLDVKGFPNGTYMVTLDRALQKEPLKFMKI
jgi:hypothetical protein